ncbi:MAG: WD40-like beta Propeller containing protein [Paenibacillaceae bacterium]|jgi:oligogalacturonide lyase|nr:WD40-like beta Propeller containing protein [Paenibacillaceae bacterium]
MDKVMGTGSEFPSGKMTYKDGKTGREVIRLTSGDSNNYHLYFTDNSFTSGDKEIYFLSDRGADRPLLFNFFRMELDTGRVTQITDEAEGVITHTKTPDSEFLVYTTGNRLRKINTRTGRAETIFQEETGRFTMESPFISPDKKFVGLTMNEQVEYRIGDNYSGFKERMFAVKHARIRLVYLNGSGWLDIHHSTHQLGHFQFAPDDSTLAMFCHEGPWNLVDQRIWLLDTVSREVKPCFRQGMDDCVGHEFWTRDGSIFFDNRRKWHDGTITSDKTQATVNEDHSDQMPYIGLADKSGNVLRTIEMPFYCNHYHANTANDLLIGDEVEDLVAIDLRSGRPQLTILCTHQTSWRSQITHCHPTFSWDNGKILFASDREGTCQLYLLDSGL